MLIPRHYRLSSSPLKRGEDKYILLQPKASSWKYRRSPNSYLIGLTKIRNHVIIIVRFQNRRRFI